VLPAAADARQAAALTRARLSSDAGGASDHLATIRAFNQWKGAAAVRRLLSPALGGQPQPPRLLGQPHVPLPPWGSTTCPPVAPPIQPPHANNPSPFLPPPPARL
jgi:hypothetical protein